ncbi:MAG: radical SAM protein [Myxococcales bacterium]|jgi:MoaA/NifB/PqqE/SkfB family radical SAM enzyme|nr:MAG: radical SAM protein [Myxococcales bacterium]
MTYFDGSQKLRLARSLVTKTSPAYVQYYITARCNLACQQCNIIYADADSAEMNIDQIRRTAENLAEIGVCMVLLIGGEPFVRRDLPEIIEAFTSNNIHVRMQTNGLATEEMLARCIAAGGHDISISLDTLSGSMQDSINGGFDCSWDRAIRTISMVNRMFPANGTAFFGTVLMPENLEHVVDVLEFATAIGWGVSLVPAHVSTPDRPQGFRSFDSEGTCRFPPSSYARVREVLATLKSLRDRGLNLYDSDEYLDDIYRFIAGEPVRWRRRNDDVCDSPSLYFALEPNGNVNPCCDFRLGKPIPAWAPDFPERYRSGEVHREAYSVVRNCAGCMYGSYPEITITARFLKPMLQRFVFFNLETDNLLKPLSEAEIVEVARAIHARNERGREARLLPATFAT